jgi:hypothetical protein
MTDLMAGAQWARQRIAVLLAALAVIAGMAGVDASSSLAVNSEGYVNGILHKNETRDSKSHHMLENIAQTNGFGSLCVDVYLEPGGYSGSECSTGWAAIYPQSKYGYGRAWETSSEGDVDAVVSYE